MREEKFRDLRGFNRLACLRKLYDLACCSSGLLTVGEPQGSTYEDGNTLIVLACTA